MRTSSLLWNFSWILGATAIKFLGFHLYYSTDLNVHHYWISLTGSKNWDEWYTNTDSEWTLDYPPAFAIFQLLIYYVFYYISNAIKLFPASSEIQQIGNAIDDIIEFPPKQLNSLSIYILRSSVILSDIVLVYSLYR